MRRRLIENGKYQTVLPQTDHLILAGRVCPAGNPHARFGLSRDAFGLRRQRWACTPCLGSQDSNSRMSNGGTCPRMRSSGTRGACGVNSRTGIPVLSQRVFKMTFARRSLIAPQVPVAVDPYCAPPERTFLTEVTSNPTEP